MRLGKAGTHGAILGKRHDVHHLRGMRAPIPERWRAASRDRRGIVIGIGAVVGCLLALFLVLAVVQADIGCFEDAYAHAGLCVPFDGWPTSEIARP